MCFFFPLESRSHAKVVSILHPKPYIIQRSIYCIAAVSVFHSFGKGSFGIPFLVVGHESNGSPGVNNSLCVVSVAGEARLLQAGVVRPDR